MKTLLILTAYIAPYLFIPVAFRFAGGIFANLSNSASKFGNGFSQRQKQFRTKNRQETMGRAKTGNRFKGNSKLEMLGNRLGRRPYEVAAGRLSLSPSKRKAMREGSQGAHDLHEAQDILRNPNAEFAELMKDDTMLESFFAKDEKGEWGTESSIRKHLLKNGKNEADVQRMVTASRGKSKRAFGMAAVMQNSTTGTGFSSGAGEMFAAIDLVAGGDRHLGNTMLGEMRNMGGGARRPDLFKAGFGDSIKTREAQFARTEAAKTLTGPASAAAQARVMAEAQAMSASNPAEVLKRDAAIARATTYTAQQEAEDAAMEASTGTLDSLGAEAAGGYEMATARPAYLRRMSSRRSAMTTKSTASARR